MRCPDDDTTDDRSISFNLQWALIFLPSNGARSVRAVQQAYKLTTEELRVCSAQDLAVARIGSMEVPAGQ